MLSALLTLMRQLVHMLFPPNFNLIDVEACRRHHVMLATLAMTASVMEFHINLAEFYEERLAALRNVGPKARIMIGDGSSSAVMIDTRGSRISSR